MVTFVLQTVVIAVLGLSVWVSGADTNSKCLKWDWDSGLDKDKSKEDRVWYTQKDSVNLVNACEPKNYFCDIRSTFGADIHCSQFDAAPRQNNFPPGDVCTGNHQCFTGNCTFFDKVGVCQGLAKNHTCTNDRECNPGLFWYKTSGVSGTCQEVSKHGESCNASRRCEFGHLCANHTCTRVGSLPLGARFNITDGELYPFPVVEDRAMYWACGNFTAHRTDFTSEGGINTLLECDRGPERLFEDYERDNDTEPCQHEARDVNGKILTFLGLSITRKNLLV